MKKFLIAVSLLVSLTLFLSWTNSNDTSTSKAETKAQINIDPQSEETMKIAMDFMGAMGKGDMKTMVSLMHEDMVWQNGGDKSMPWIGPWKGKKVILEEFMPKFGENFKTVKWEPNDAIANGDTAAFFGQMVGLLTKSNEKTSEFTYALRVKVKDGKVILWNWFEDSFEVSRAYHHKSKK
ncbi:nuclear transport factor 2 family protein [uncultured Aquimarina sp.]|uniref:nuclear transport factor 2 family protein n=1 Tax=uncultured Aquimarina sp. TaxID=575652 RepID=UPI0026258BB5|nr:nuclear transport factor 2 family protein [uncultured Aquimarina sp.]